MNPTIDEIIETAKTPNGEMVRTVTDIRLDKLEAKITELLKINEELRTANKELYAYASQVQPVQVQPEPSAQPTQVTAAAAVPVRDPAMDQIRKAREDAMLNNIITDMGYRKTEPAPAVKSQFTNEQNKDGM